MYRLFYLELTTILLYVYILNLNLLQFFLCSCKYFLIKKMRYRIDILG